MDTRDRSLSIPLDVLLHVLAYLPLESVLAFRRTSKRFYAVTRLRSLWVTLFDQHCAHFPHPHVDDLGDLSADDLESLTQRTLALRHNWTSPEPVPRRQRTLTEPNARIIFLQFLPGRSNRWLISVRMATRPQTYLLQCWDVATEQPRCVAELRHADGPYGGVVLNSDPNSTAMLALQSAQTETLSIDFDAEDPDVAFETEATIDGIRELHLLSGSTLVTRRIGDDGALSLWDLSDLCQEKLHLLNPSLVQPDDRIQAIHLARDYALVVRIQSIELYSTTPRPNIFPVFGAPLAYPLAQFKFQWRTDSVVLSEQHTFFTNSRPIHLLVRFGSTYPWPVNLLHHYVLRPNVTYHTRSSHTHSHVSTTEYNLPYGIIPSLVQTISSPVHMFGHSAMVFGRYGTALWLDNHTEDMGGPNERGQRLVGATLDTVSKTVVPSMVFGVRDDDAWTRIAMDEEVGRIAIGHADGAITLLEY